jgi:hypothetical protein
MLFIFPASPKTALRRLKLLSKVRMTTDHDIVVRGTSQQEKAHNSTHITISYLQ